MRCEVTLAAGAGGQSFTALMDSGAEVNVMTWTFAQKNGVTKLGPAVTTLYDMSGRQIPCKGEVDVPLSIRDSRGQSKVQTVHFSVALTAAEPLVLGYPWHAQAEPIQNFPAQTWRWPLSQAKIEVVSPEDFYLDFRDKADCYAIHYNHSITPIDEVTLMTAAESDQSAHIHAVSSGGTAADDDQGDQNLTQDLG